MMEADIAAAAADISSTLVYAGVSVYGTCSPLDKSSDMDGDGFLHQSDYEFVGKRNDFTGGIPQPKAIVTLDSVKCAVDAMTDDGAAVTLRVTRFDDRTSTGGII